MKFGQSAIASGPDVIYTPMLSRLGGSTHYWINLQAVSVGNRRMQHTLEGNVIYSFIPLLGSIFICLLCYVLS